MADMHQIIVRRLEDAGLTLARLEMGRIGTADERCAWPKVSQNFWDIMGYAEHATIIEQMAALAKAKNQPRFRPSGAAIDRLDEVLGWLPMIERVHWRQTVARRTLMHPVSEQHLYSWTQIARDMGRSRSTVRRWFNYGVQVIIEGNV